MAEYSQVAYWNERYAREPDPFEWYQEYGALQHILSRYITPKQTTALVVGCGTSNLSEELHRAQCKNVVSIDFSQVCIDINKKKYANQQGMQFGHMDVRKLEFGPNRFDLIIDKGTLDSILCADDAEVAAAKAISECSRVLQPGGVFVMVSHAAPEHREALLKVPNDQFVHYQYATIAKPRVEEQAAAAAEPAKDEEVHYVYVAIKGKQK